MVETRNGFKINDKVVLVRNNKAVWWGTIDEFHKTDGRKVWVVVDRGEREEVFANDLSTALGQRIQMTESLDAGEVQGATSTVPGVVSVKLDSGLVMNVPTAMLQLEPKKTKR